MSRIRSVLARCAKGDVTVTRRGSGYVLSCDPMCVDVFRFGRLVERARAADDLHKLQLLGHALDMWHGPPLGDTAPDGVRELLCAGLEEARLAATEDLMDARLRLGHHAEVVGELMPLVVRYPDRQRPVGQLMCALYGTGRIPDAHAYQRVKQRLADEFGLDPGAELQRLELAILRAEPCPGLWAGPSAGRGRRRAVPAGRAAGRPGRP